MPIHDLILALIAIAVWVFAIACVAAWLRARERPARANILAGYGLTAAAPETSMRLAPTGRRLAASRTIPGKPMEQN